MGLFSWLGKLCGSPIQPKSAPPPPFRAPTPQRPLASKSVAQTAPSAPQRPQQRAPKKLNLDPGQFAPLSGAKLKARSLLVGGSLFRNPWFGRRDQQRTGFKLSTAERRE